MGNFIDLTGQKFGRLTVIRRATKEELSDKKWNNITYWICRCDCGNETMVQAQTLKDGRTKSCGCLSAETTSKRASHDLTGKRFGKLTVIRKANDDEKPKTNEGKYGNWWICNCDCGSNNLVKKGSYLTGGRVKSCGCYNKEMSFIKNHVDITGQKFGKLTALRIVDRPEFIHKRGLFWECTCDCGNTTIVSSNALRTGGTTSCGCMASKAEMFIRNILNKYSVNFETQYWFDDLRSEITNYVLKFDFAIFDKNKELSFLLEYDGIQHINGTRFSPRKEENEEKFMKIQIYDKQKNDYCDKNNIDLLRIPHWEFDNIEGIVVGKLKEKEII